MSSESVLADRRHNPGKHSIHNHSLIKSLRLTRPGGLVVALTSRYTMDAANPAARREMGALADLVAAVRLPISAHEAIAGTKVVTDLLTQRRRGPGREQAGMAWEQIQEIDVPGGDTIHVNEFFAHRPDQTSSSPTGLTGFAETRPSARAPTTRMTWSSPVPATPPPNWPGS